MQRSRFGIDLVLGVSCIILLVFISSTPTPLPPAGKSSTCHLCEGEPGWHVRGVGTRRGDMARTSLKTFRTVERSARDKCAQRRHFQQFSL